MQSKKKSFDDQTNTRDGAANKALVVMWAKRALPVC